MKTMAINTMNVLLMSLIALAVWAEPNANIKSADKLKPAETSITQSGSKMLSLVGSIYDMNSSEALAGASIELNGTTWYADLDGKFNIKSETKLEGKYLTVSLISYESKQIKLEKDQSGELKIALKQR